MKIARVNSFCVMRSNSYFKTVQTAFGAYVTEVQYYYNNCTSKVFL